MCAHSKWVPGKRSIGCDLCSLIGTFINGLIGWFDIQSIFWHLDLDERRLCTPACFCFSAIFCGWMDDSLFSFYRFQSRLPVMLTLRGFKMQYYRLGPNLRNFFFVTQFSQFINKGYRLMMWKKPLPGRTEVNLSTYSSGVVHEMTSRIFSDQIEITINSTCIRFLAPKDIP